MNIWNQELMGQFQNDYDSEQYLAWLKYYVWTEQYDRTFPGHMLHGEWLPEMWALKYSNQNALRLRTELKLDNSSPMKNAALQLPFDEQVRELKRCLNKMRNNHV